LEISGLARGEDMNKEKVPLSGAQTLESLGREGTYEKVAEYLSDKPRGKILDIPTGSGVLAKRLFDLKFDVTCCDISPTQFLVDELTVDQGDLNERIPYDDEQFDYVCCLEGVEHTENPYNAIRELSRVLKPGGILIMTTPNYLNIERRLKFLVTGFFTKPVSQQMFKDVFGGKTHGMHLSPLGYSIIRFALEHAGFQITKITYVKKKPKQVFLKPFVWFIRLYTILYPKNLRERYWISETSSNEILDGGNTLVIYAQKTKTG
jgi:2-polyprenyl-3-methyl-5-hydroxy-6-metoxy-1,4-benzoquinol methylase